MNKKEYNKYKGKFKRKKNLEISLFKKFHNKVKGFYIKKFSNNINTLIDIGSGRGNDIYYYEAVNITRVIGIEPSVHSINIAIVRYKKEFINKEIKAYYLNGISEKNWNDGSAALRKEDIEHFKHFFSKNIKADRFHFNWVIHYTMDTEDSFKGLLSNLKNHSNEKCRIIILCIDGEKLHKILQEKKGVYTIEKNDEKIFEITAKYNYKSKLDSPYGNQIKVFMTDTYGLEEGIMENLVIVSNLTKELDKLGFKLIHKKKHIDIKIKNNLRESKEISDLYVGLVYER